MTVACLCSSNVCVYAAIVSEYLHASFTCIEMSPPYIYMSLIRRRSHMYISRWLSIFCRDGFQTIRMCRRSHTYMSRWLSFMCRIQIIFMCCMALVRLAMALGFYCIHTHAHTYTHTHKRHARAIAKYI